MNKSAHYNIRMPRHLVGEFLSDEFYIGRGPHAVKIAAWWQSAPLRDRYHLLKTAQEAGEEDLSTVYDKALATLPRERGEDEEE